MNQDPNNLNQNDLNTQGSNGIPNNQDLNNTVNQNVNVNQPTFSSQPQVDTNDQQPMNQTNVQEPYQQPMNQIQPTPQPMNSFGNENTNQSLNSKPPKKMNLGLIVGIIAVVAVVGIGIFGNKLFLNNVDSNNSSENNIGGNNDSEIVNTRWKIQIQGKEYKLPFNLKTLTDQGFYYTGDNWENAKFDGFTQAFGLNKEELYNGIPSAGINKYIASFELYLIQKENKSRTDENIVVAGFSIGNVSTDFFSINNIGCNSTVDEVVNALGIDLTSDEVQKSDDLYNKSSYIQYLDSENNLAVIFYFENGKVWHFQIFINDRDSLK